MTTDTRVAYRKMEVGTLPAETRSIKMKVNVTRVASRQRRSSLLGVPPRTPLCNTSCPTVDGRLVLECSASEVKAHTCPRDG